ncbi:MAG: type II toxin-antitoxin system prevent-host-death family antitoxin [Mesorhizobium sp.]|nr:type II toxin-antitoxin system prevent-host-death family antitoxin [Mesorhizobium sp.]
MNIREKPPVTMTSREFNQDTARVKREARKGPVIITERGVPSLVVLSIQAFDDLKRQATDGEKSEPRPFKSLAESLADTSPEGDFEFAFPEFKGKFKGFEFE